MKQLNDRNTYRVVDHAGTNHTERHNRTGKNKTVFSTDFIYNKRSNTHSSRFQENLKRVQVTERFITLFHGREK